MTGTRLVRRRFTEVERFEEYGAEQWLGVWSAARASSEAAPNG